MTVRRLAARSAALAVLMAGVTIAHGASAAESEAAKWRRLNATAADYNARTWVRMESPDGRWFWVDAASARGLTARSNRPRKVLILSPDSFPHIAHVGEGVRYSVSEATFDCRAPSLWVHNWFFGADGHLMAERVPEAGEFSENDLPFQTVCKGGAIKAGARLKTIAVVLASEPDLGAE